MQNLFDILNLLSNLFKFALHINNDTGNASVVTLGTDGVCLTVQLLHKEVKLSTRRLLRCADVVECAEM